MQNETEKLVDIDTIAQFLSLTPKNLRKRVSDKSIPHRRLGDTSHARVRFYLSEVSSWIDGAPLKVIEGGVTVIKQNAEGRA